MADSTALVYMSEALCYCVKRLRGAWRFVNLRSKALIVSISYGVSEPLLILAYVFISASTVGKDVAAVANVPSIFYNY